MAEVKIIDLDEIHQTPYSRNGKYQKTIISTRRQFYWPKIKKEIVEYIDRCIKCQQVKVEHQHPLGLMQHIPILDWKWETIMLDFITCLPKTFKQNDAIMVIVGKLSKATHFILVNTTHRA